MKINGKRPNILIIMTDEERYPPPYENEEARKFRIETGKGRELIRANGMEFHSHYAASTACSPSRTTIYTGQYPSLHGVSQTPGIGKSSFDPAMFWLQPKTVPTLGAWFRAGGYQTHWRGKWHLSHEDLMVPGTRTSLLSTDINGNPYPERVKLYHEANQLDKYGFDGWVGPEPHGSNQANDGTNRDGGFADQTCRMLDQLDHQAREHGGDAPPFLLVSSFVNPHDIVFSMIWGWFTKFNDLASAGKLPYIADPPTLHEALESKPRAQKDYAMMYPRFYFPQQVNEKYYQFYYFLMAEVDRHILKVYQKLQSCCFFENTIVLFTSDHGDLLGSHGGMMQKWYTAYEEALHVPMIMSNPVLFPKPASTSILSSHIDILPTLLGLADIDEKKAAARLRENHSEVQDLVGRDLSPILAGKPIAPEEPLYFMTDDNPETGLSMYNRLTNRTYRAVIQPSHLESVITKIDGKTWKYTRYFDNPRFANSTGNPDNVTIERGIPDEFECYNVSDDPTETRNLLSPVKPELPAELCRYFQDLLEKQRKQKRKLPKNLNQFDDSPDSPMRT